MTQQGHTRDGRLTMVSLSSMGRPRRSVVLGSFGSLVAGVILATTALPAVASSQVVAGTTVPARHAVVATSTTTSTTTTIPSTTVPPTTVPSTTTPTTVPAHTVATPAVHRHATVVVHAVTTTTSPRTTRTTDVTPTTVARPTTPTTVKASPPAKSVPNVALKLSANIAPSPNFLSSGTGSIVNGVAVYQNPCITPQSTWPVFTNDTACTNYVLSAINNARSVEGVKAMVLPSNWSSLTTPQQLFVVADLERVDRGLAPYLGLNAQLNAEAQSAALRKADPGLAKGFPVGNDAQGIPGMGGAWSSGYSVLVADYFWMYADGWGGKSNTANIACTSPSAAGCWAHREELLGTAPGFNPGVGLGCANCEMGTGFAIIGGSSASYVDLIEIPAPGALPPMTFTWAKDVLPFLS